MQYMKVSQLLLPMTAVWIWYALLVLVAGALVWCHVPRKSTLAPITASVQLAREYVPPFMSKLLRSVKQRHVVVHMPMPMVVDTQTNPSCIPRLCQRATVLTVWRVNGHLRLGVTGCYQLSPTSDFVTINILPSADDMLRSMKLN